MNEIIRMQAARRILAVIWVILLFSNFVFANGVLDPTFGTGGKLNFRLGGTTNLAADAALQPDGKIVIVGTAAPPGQSAGFNDIGIARLNPDGTLDGTFGAGGMVITDFNGNEDGARVVVVLPDGKILVGGHRRTNASNSMNFALVRYNANGSLDTSFDGDGKVVTDFPESLSEGISVLIPQADGKFIAAGSLYLGGPTPENSFQLAFVRYNQDGGIDTTYGNNGIQKIIFASNVVGYSGPSIQTDGKIIINVSYSFPIPGCTPSKTNPCTGFQSYLQRFHPNLTVDRKFGRRQGKEFLFVSSSGAYPQADGRILLGGFPLVSRFTSNGRLETIFEYAAFPNQSTQIQNGPFGLVVRPNGAIVGCRALNGGNGYDDIGVVQFTPDGRVVGYEQRDFFTANDFCSKILIQPDGKILVVGSAQIQQQSVYSFAVLRYLDIAP
jgi:uncharacterized delta-60 repeat protein